MWRRASFVGLFSIIALSTALPASGSQIPGLVQNTRESLGLPQPNQWVTSASVKKKVNFPRLYSKWTAVPLLLGGLGAAALYAYSPDNPNITPPAPRADGAEPLGPADLVPGYKSPLVREELPIYTPLPVYGAMPTQGAPPLDLALVLQLQENIAHLQPLAQAKALTPPQLAQYQTLVKTLESLLTGRQRIPQSYIEKLDALKQAQQSARTRQQLQAIQAQMTSMIADQQAYEREYRRQNPPAPAPGRGGYEVLKSVGAYSETPFPHHNLRAHLKDPQYRQHHTEAPDPRWARFLRPSDPLNPLDDQFAAESARIQSLHDYLKYTGAERPFFEDTVTLPLHKVHEYDYATKLGRAISPYRATIADYRRQAAAYGGSQLQDQIEKSQAQSDRLKVLPESQKRSWFQRLFS